jgi:hypothetical protein
MFCGECGARNPDTNQFCRNCGKPLGRRQPAVQPEAQPAVPPAAPAVAYSPAGQPAPALAYQPAAQPAAAGAAAPGKARNWLGIVSVIAGIFSWAVLTGLLAIVAILLGIAGTVMFRKATGRIGISGIIGIVLGIAAIGIVLVLG